MPVVGSDLLVIERGGVQYKTPVSGLPATASVAIGVHAREPGMISGRYLSQAINGSALTTIAAAANRLDFVPFVPAKAITVNELALEVTTLIAGGQARIGIYSSNASEAPDALLTGQGSLLTTDAVGVKASVITNIVLNANTIYWLAILSSSTQTYRGVAVAALQSLGHNATLNAVYSLLRATATFASGLPVTAPLSTLTSAVAPWVRLKIA